MHFGFEMTVVHHPRAKIIAYQDNVRTLANSRLLVSPIIVRRTLNAKQNNDEKQHYSLGTHVGLRGFGSFKQVEKN